MSVWQGSTLLYKLKQQSSLGRVPRGLFTDIDRTFLLREGGWWQRRRYLRATKKLTKYTDRYHFPRVAVTSRDLPMMLEDQAKGLLPSFDAILGSMGAERFILHDNGYVRDKAYDHFIEQSLGFGRAKIYPACLSFLETANSWAKSIGLSDLDLSLQPRDRLGSDDSENKPPQPYKISYNFFACNLAVPQQLKALMQKHLASYGHTRVNVIFSVDSIKGRRVRYNIDVVPLSKGEAAAYLIDEIEEQTENVSWFYAGDSGNDESALANVGDGAIIVGGHTVNLELLGGNWLPIERSPRWFTDSKSRRRIYIDDGSLLGPESLIRALADIDQFNLSNTD